MAASIIYIFIYLYICGFLELNIMNRRGPVLQIISLSKVV